MKASGKIPRSNLKRRNGLGALLLLVYPILKMVIGILTLQKKLVHNGKNQKSARPGSAALPNLFVFQSYQVGDAIMALPAITKLSHYFSITVICRPDCVFLFKAVNLKTLAFANSFFSGPSLRSFRNSIRGAWSLRGELDAPVLDLDADPRTAFFLKVAGAQKTYSFIRSYGWFFDQTFPVSQFFAHQMEKNYAVADGFLVFKNLQENLALLKNPGPHEKATLTRGSKILLSCWTWKDEKNWPLEYWGQVLTALLAAGKEIQIIVPPDGDADFQRFRNFWTARVEFISGSLEVVFDKAKNAETLICTDNFLGHMGAYLGKPVFWINGSSDDKLVAPSGPNTYIMQLTPMPCRPCGHRCTNPRYKQCLLDLRPENVQQELLHWMGQIPKISPLP